MATDTLKLHRNVLAALGGMHTAPALVNKLSKIASETEDRVLKDAIEKLNYHLKSSGYTQRSGQIGEQIRKYVQEFIDKQQPAWQVIALREGWQPPAELE